MPQGTVKWFDRDKGFGFIADAEGGPDLIVEGSDVPDRDLAVFQEGREVDFEVVVAAKGPQARRIRPRK